MRKCLALAAAGLLALAVAAPAGAGGNVDTLRIVGPGVLSLWTTAPESVGPGDDGPYVDTLLLAADQVNGPPKYGPSGGAIFVQMVYHLEGGEWVVDSTAIADAWDVSATFRQPLESATVSANGVPLWMCDADFICADTGDTISFDASWTGYGPIDREPWDPEIIVTPGVSVELFNAGRIDVAIRAVDVEFTLEGATIPAGSRYVTDPFWRSPVGQHGSRIFRVHNGWTIITMGR
jgi:hypothetical protein